MSDKNREKSHNTDNQETQYIKFTPDVPDNQEYGDTKVFKPLKRVNPSPDNPNYRRQNINDYPNPEYRRQNVNDYPNPEYRRQNVNDYPNPEYRRQNVNDYSNPEYRRQNVNDYSNPEYRRQNVNDYPNPEYRRQNVNDYSNPERRQKPVRQEKKNPDSVKSKSRPKKKRKKHSLGCIGKIIRSLIIILLVLFIIYSLLALLFIKQIDYVESAPINHYSYALSNRKVRNILIIGTDTRDSSEERGRSDSMMLLSLNSNTDKMYLTSIMRDSYVEIDGYGWDKLTHAYSYGGAELLMSTIEKNFSVKIDDYIAVNFNAFAAVIDAVNGIEIDISDEEAEEINTILQAEVNELMGDSIDSDLLEKGGKLILNGKQALSYSRIRYVGNSDFERTQRQRDVTEKIIKKLKSFNPSSLGKIVKSALPQFSTNMTTGELYLLSLRIPFLFSYDLEQQRIPAEDTYYNTYTDDGGDALGIDFDANLEIIKNTIFR